MAQIDDHVEELVHSYERGRITRRDFFKRATALGLGASAATAVLAQSAAARPGARAARSAAAVTKGGTFIEGYDRPFTPITTVSAGWIDPSHDALLESLITVDPKGNLVPKLAESWTLSADAKTWTIKLRKGVRFHSGALVTPQKVVEDLKLFSGAKTGQHPYWFTNVSSIKVGPGNTVVIKCKEPFASLGFLLRQWFTNIFNNDTAKKNPKTYGTKVVDGTGPFTLAEFDSASHVLVKRFENYSGSIVPWFQNKGKAYLDAIRWVPISEASQRANEIVSGNVHAVKNPLPTDLDSLKSNDDLVVIEQQEAGAVVLGLNFKKTNLGFDDLRVRQAISHAIDREAIVKAILLGHGAPAYNPFPPGYVYYEKKADKFNRYDTKKAEALLDAAGWKKSGGTREKDGQKLEFTIVNFTDTIRNQVGDAITAMLGKVGVSAKMNNLEAGAFFQTLGTGPDAYFFNWLWVDFPRIYQVLGDSRFIPAPNWANAKVPEVDKAMDGWSFAKNNAELEAAARKIQLAVAEKLPVTALYIQNVIWVHNKKVHGWRPINPTSLYPFYNDVWLES